MRSVIGTDKPLRQALGLELEARGLPLSPLSVEGPRITALLVEREDGDDAGLDDVRRAVIMRGGEIGLVSSRPESDPGLRALRRSGLPYTIVRSGPCIEDAAPRVAFLPPSLRGPVLCRRRLAKELADEVEAGRIGNGATLELGRTTSGRDAAAALRETGCFAWVVPRWLHRLLEVLGAPTFDVEGTRLARTRRARVLATSLTLVLLGLVASPRVLAQDVSVQGPICAEAERDAGRLERLARVAASLGGSDKDDAAARARAASERVAPYRSALLEMFGALRDAALQTTDDARARQRLRRVRLSLGDEGIVPEQAIARGCGADHLADEAWTNRAFDVVVLCPGFVLLEAEDGDPDRVANAAAFLLAHELGHVIDASGNDAASERSADVHAATLVAAVPSIEVERALRPFCGLPPSHVHEDGATRVERALRQLRERGRPYRDGGGSTSQRDLVLRPSDVGGAPRPASSVRVSLG